MKSVTVCYSVRCDFFSHLFKDLNTPRVTKFVVRVRAPTLGDQSSFPALWHVRIESAYTRMHVDCEIKSNIQITQSP